MIKRQQRYWWSRAAILAGVAVAQQYPAPRAWQRVIWNMDVAVEPDNRRTIENTLFAPQLTIPRFHNFCFSAEYQPNRPLYGEDLEWLATHIKDEHPCFPHGLYLFWWPPHTMTPKIMLSPPLFRRQPGQCSVAFGLVLPTQTKKAPRRLVASERLMQSVPLSEGEITPRVDGI